LSAGAGAHLVGVPRRTDRVKETLLRYAEPGLIAAVLGAIYLVTQPSSADHAAQVFRSGLFDQEGISAWNNLWFGGHHLPGYGVLFPPLASLLGPRMVGFLATIAASLLFAAIAYRRWGDRARLGVLWFAAGASISLFTGRLTFALGVPIALAAVFAAQRGQQLAAIGFAGLTSLASPVAALFLACGAVGFSVAERRRAGLGIAAAAATTAVALAFAFPEGGTEPFVFSSFQPAILVALAVFVALPREEKLLRYGVAAYALVLAGAFLINSPMGGNATRMGSLLLGPALAFGLWQRQRFNLRRQRFALALLVPVLVYWQWSPVVRDLEDVHAQPSVEAGYYAPVRDFLRGTPNPNAYRVEVLPAAHHWESAYVPRGIYIARGWERQLDRKLNPLFYDDLLTFDEYRNWLDELGVGYVAVPDAPLDYGRVRGQADRPRAPLPRAGLRQRRLDRLPGSRPGTAGGGRRRPGEADPGGLRGRRGRSGYRADQSALDPLLVDRAGDRLRRAVARWLHHPRCHRARAFPGRRRLLASAGPRRRSPLRRSPGRDDRAGADG
jgi:hypothetical protein